MGDHETDVFITLAAAYRRKMPARQGVIGRVAPGACTKSKSDPIRKNPDIAARLRSFAYNLIRAAGGSNIRNARWRAALDLNLILQLPRLH